jgi:hypothetical protein
MHNALEIEYAQYTKINFSSLAHTRTRIYVDAWSVINVVEPTSWGPLHAFTHLHNMCTTVMHSHFSLTIKSERQRDAWDWVF